MKALQIISMINNGEIEKLLELAQQELQVEVAKSEGKQDTLRVVKKLMAKKDLQEHLRGYLVHKDKYYFTDGTMVIESSTDLGFEKASSQLDLGKVFKLNHTTTTTIATEQVKIMIEENKTIEKKNKEIKSHNKKWGLDDPLLATKIFVINNEIAFNPVKLLDMIKATGSNKIAYSGATSPASVGDNMNNLILPIRFKQS